MPDLLFSSFLSPNLITLVGFSFIFFNVFTAIYFSPNLEPSSYQWLGYTCAPPPSCLSLITIIV